MPDVPHEYLELKAPDTRWWQFWMSKSDARRQLKHLWEYSISQTEATTVALERLDTRMTAAEDAAYARAGELVGLIKAEFASLKSQIDAAVQDKDAAVQAGVESALADDAAADTERLSGLIGDLESVLPAQVPEVPVPDAGQPAEDPADEDDSV